LRIVMAENNIVTVAGKAWLTVDTVDEDVSPA
jgi:hypothetical protein